jgi:hypothetical protein
MCVTEKLRTEFACVTPKIKFLLTGECDLYLTVCNVAYAVYRVQIYKCRF